MKALKNLLIILTTTLVFTSCIEMKETIVFNKKGGGTYSLIVNTTEFMEKTLEGKYVLKDLMPIEDPYFFYEHFKKFSIKTVDSISNLAGISNAKVNYIDSLTIGYSFDFENIDVLNGVVKNYNAGGNSYSIDTTTYTYSHKNLFSRIDCKKYFDEMNVALDEMEGTYNELKKYNPAVLDSGFIAKGIDPVKAAQLIETSFMAMENLSFVGEYSFPDKIKSIECDTPTEIVDKKTVVQTIYYRKEKDKNSSIKVTF